jgi:hypothetical protein
VTLHLWRGAYELHDLKIEKSSGKVPVPLLTTPLVDLAVDWSALLHGGIVATVEFEKPVVSLVDGSGQQDSQAGKGVDWRQMLENLIPIRLDEVKVSRGTVTFRNFISNPPVDLHATDVEAVVTNLTNVRNDDRRPAAFRAKAAILGEAPLETKAEFDPFGHFDDFSFEVKVTRIELPKLNDLLRAYALIDVKRGEGEFVMQLDAANGRVTGYAKPLFHDIQIMDPKEDIKNPLKLAWKAVAAGVVGIFKNHKQDQFGTRIPIEGPIDNPKVSALAAIGGILHNAFVEAFKPDFEKLKEDAK